MRRTALATALFIAALSSLHAGFLYNPANPSPNGFLTPTFNFGSIVYEYSAWDIFYAPHTAGNFPDLFAPYGGVEISPGVWAPESRVAAGFAPNSLYNPGNPLAFWDNRNATISYAWKFATATGGITGFDALKFRIDTTGFLNAYGGTFFVSASGNDLFLNYQIVPEPTSSMLLISSLLFSPRRRRRASRNKPEKVRPPVIA